MATKEQLEQGLIEARQLQSILNQNAGFAHGNPEHPMADIFLAMSSEWNPKVSQKIIELQDALGIKRRVPAPD